MSPDDKAAHALSLGWRIVATVPANPADVTYEHVAPFFSGDLSALTAIARASFSATEAATPHAPGLSEPLASGQRLPRRSTRHPHSTPNQEPANHARQSA
jgi:hypothetical protein